MILLIGLDGYDAKWAPRLQELGYATAPLASPVPLSWVAWNTIATGVDAPTWGVSYDPNDYMKFGQREHERPPYFWEWASVAGATVAIVNWPFVLQPHIPKGVLVCGYPALEKWFVLPSSENGQWDYNELDLSNRWGLGRAGKPGEEVRQRMLETLPQQHAEACASAQQFLVRRFVAQVKRLRPRVAFLGMMDLDRLSHYTQGEMRHEAFLGQVLDYVLAGVQVIERELEPKCTIICSDHGLDLEAQFRPQGKRNKTHGIRLPNSMKGILALKQEGWTLPAQTAQQIDVAPMVLNRLGIDHDLKGVDRSTTGAIGEA